MNTLQPFAFGLLLLGNAAVSSARQDAPDSAAIEFFGAVTDRCGGNGLAATLLVTSPVTGDTLVTSRSELPTGAFSATIRATGSAVAESYLPVLITVTVSGLPALRREISVPLMRPQGPIRIDFPLGELPAVSAIVEAPGRLDEWKPALPAFEGTSSGLTVHAIVTTEALPLLNYLYFEAGEAAIPERYHCFDHPGQTESFREEEIPADGVRAHAWIMDLIGSRLRRFPLTRVRVNGTDSEQPERGETKDVAARRARVVHDYLVNIWGIDSSRVGIGSIGGWPKFPSNKRDPLGIVENRRAEIVSEDWEIVKPVIITRLRRHPYPASVVFKVDNGVDDGLVAERRLELRQSGALWSTLDGIGRSERDIVLESWAPDSAGGDTAGKRELLPRGPLEARLIVGRADGIECSSEPFLVPVTTAGGTDRRGRDSTVIIFTLIQIRFDSPELGPLNARIVRELAPLISSGSRIVVTGHTDLIGLEDRNRKLSEQRAYVVATAIRKALKPGTEITTTVRGMGGEIVIYSNALPEGRTLGRCVRVTIIRPE